MKQTASILIFFLIFRLLPATGQDFSRILLWENPVSFTTENGGESLHLYFKGALIDQETGLPVFSEFVALDNENISGIEINKITSKPLTNTELSLIPSGLVLDAGIKPIYEIAYISKKPYVKVSFNTIFKRDDGKVARLESVNASITLSNSSSLKSGTGTVTFANQSVLSTGNWYKFMISQTGMHKISYQDLVGLGLNPASINPKNIRLYGNGGGMLSEKNSDFRHDDLQENPILVVGEEDGKFDQTDYIVFYGKGPDVWKLRSNNSTFSHSKNIYSDHSYYFITVDLGEGKRIQTEPSLTETPNQTVTRFNDYVFQEIDRYNLIKSGREWYGEVFDIVVKYDYSFNFPDYDPSFPATLNTKVAARSKVSSNFKFTVNGVEVSNVSVPAVFYGPNGDYARTVTKSDVFTSASSQFDVSVSYQKTASDGMGWLDYFEINFLRKLRFNGGQLAFRDILTVGQDNISEFRLENSNLSVQIWEVTDPTNVKQISATLNGQNHVFKLETSVLREFVAFDGTAYFNILPDSYVPNQNLHALRNIDYVIVAHPEFMAEAERLASFHRNSSGLDVAVVTPAQVYNEFSSGAQDIGAIRGLMRMLYKTADEGNEPGYLLLFGDASYDFKNENPNNTNFVPTYQSDESLHTTQSYATDDFFGYLDDNEGMGNSDMLDIGVGRFPVDNLEQAVATVDKIIHYSTPNPEIFGSWRNTVTFVADDEDGNAHLVQADQMATLIDTTYRNYNVDKIYVDAFPQISTPGGQRFPDVNTTINNKIEKGTLIMNYTGHGGEVGWGHERFLENADIMSWKNFDRLAVFITATCEFARYDDPDRVSAGELVLLNPDGGGVGLFTTARATFGTSNLSLNLGIYDYLFLKNEKDEHYRMGDLIKLAKFESGNVINDRKFVLLGDPALQIAYPEYSVETTKINNNSISIVADTLKALAKVIIEGQILNASKELETDFNGIIYPVVYDKVSEISTLANDQTSIEKIFTIRNNVIYKGKANVNNGLFSFSFIVPKDIAYQYGFGKISYYATDNTFDALGFTENVIVGGYDDKSQVDIAGPKINLYINDMSFRNGGITNENPTLFAVISDQSGINTVGNSIGHDIVAILDENSENSFILNDYYQANLNDFQNGVIQFPMFNLSEGKHSVLLKVWDVYNNSDTASITFNVVTSDQFIINHLINYPNPFVAETYFSFTHNQNNLAQDVQVDIYNIMGQRVRTLARSMLLDGFSSEPIEWKGDSEDGSLLSQGIYIYRISVKLADGKTASAANKLIINR